MYDPLASVVQIVDVRDLQPMKHLTTIGLYRNPMRIAIGPIFNFELAGFLLNPHSPSPFTSSNAVPMAWLIVAMVGVLSKNLRHLEDTDFALRHLRHPPPPKGEVGCRRFCMSDRAALCGTLRHLDRAPAAAIFAGILRPDSSAKSIAIFIIP